MAVTITKPTRAIIILGQSQGENVLGPTLYTVRHTGLLKQINLSNGAMSNASEPFLSVFGTESSFMAEMGDLILDAGKHASIVLAPIGVSGASAAQWGPGGTYHSRLTTTISQLAALSLSIGAILWQQGENEAQDTGVTQATYVANVQAVVRAIRQAGIRAPFFVPRETWVVSASPVNGAAIRAGQVQLPSPDARVFAGPDFDTLNNSYRRDTVHFNNAGKVALAQMWAPFILQRMH